MGLSRVSSRYVSGVAVGVLREGATRWECATQSGDRGGSVSGKKGSNALATGHYSLLSGHYYAKHQTISWGVLGVYIRKYTRRLVEITGE